MKIPESNDPLGEALHALRLRGMFYSRSELTAPWGIYMPPMEGCIWFHVITSGRCFITVDDVVLEATAGDLVLVPHGRGHRAVTQTGVDTPDVTGLPQEMFGERYSVLKYGGGGAPTTLICGVAELEHPLAQDLVELLPSVIHLDGANPIFSPWLASTLRLMANEARELRPGGETIITRLADVLVIQTLRAWLDQNTSTEAGWISALRDERIGRAISRVHRDPSRDWTVASLASEAGLSRSSFAVRFRERVGESPMRYVTRIRMRFAQQLLRGKNRSSIFELATRFGYRSEAAFSRAFKRVVGTSPGSLRRTSPPGARVGGDHART